MVGWVKRDSNDAVAARYCLQLDYTLHTDSPSRRLPPDDADQAATEQEGTQPSAATSLEACATDHIRYDSLQTQVDLLLTPATATLPHNANRRRAHTQL